MNGNLDSKQSTEPFPSEIERLKIENILLKQKAELETEFRDHSKSVEEQINRGKLQLGFAGLVVLCIAWFGTYRELGDRVQKRLDKEFGNKEIQTLISQSATKAAREIIQVRLTEFTDAEHNQLKCLADKNGRDLFFLQCIVDGGTIDENRNICLNHNRGESSYETNFPNIKCDKDSSR